MTLRIAVRALTRRTRDAESLAPPTTLHPSAERLHGSLQLRHVDAGSCNGCELELNSCFSPVYDVERFGARLVASPRHADALIVSGPVTHNLHEPLLKTFDALGEPRLVITLGDCAHDCGEFRGAYGVAGSVDDVLSVDAHVAGCPPRPTDIVRVLRSFTGQ